MSRYIDADANRETMLKCAENSESMKAELCYRFAARILEEAPTIDAVQVVRCGECKYWDRSDPFFFNGVVRCECKRHENEYWTADEFCSDAERNNSEIPNS